MMSEPARKTSLENKHLRNCDYFAIIPPWSHLTMLTKNPATGGISLSAVKINIISCMLKCSSKR